MRIFGSARIKLTAAYTGVLMAISIAFSIVIIAIATHEVARPPDFQNKKLDDSAMRQIIQDRAEDTNSRIIVALLLTNAALFAIGIVGSYFLAQWTLRPIEEAMDNQARFVSDASHELRTPLAAIAMENEVILRDKNVGVKDLKSQIRSNLEEIDKLRTLTNYLLELNEDNSVDIGSVDIAKCVVDAISMNAKLASAKKIVIDNKVQSTLVNSNYSAATEILTIIINNAIKYSPDESEIKVTNQGNRLIVSDQGVGIEESELKLIFDRFYRSEKSRTSEGYGLGLSLANHLASKINASIVATNNDDRGSTFTIIL